MGDPTALALRHRLRDNGWSPLAVFPHDAPRRDDTDRRAGKAPIDGAWQRFCVAPPTNSDLKAWHRRKDAPRQNTGLALTADLVAIDIDLTDPRLAAFAKAKAFEIFGYSGFLRVGQAPKLAIIYRTDSPVANKSYKLTADPAQGVDISTRGRQLVAFGTHPKTRKPYVWLDESPLDAAVDSVPLLVDAPTKIGAFLDALDAFAPLKGYRAGSGAESLTVAVKAAEELACPLPGAQAVEAVRALVNIIGNHESDFPTGAEFAEMLMAIKGALAFDLPAAITVAQEWAAMWDGGTNDPRTVERRMRSGRPRVVGWSTLLARARAKRPDIVNDPRFQAPEPVGVQGVEPYHRVRRVPVPQARATTQRIVRTFLDMAVAYNAERAAAAADDTDARRLQGLDTRAHQARAAADMADSLIAAGDHQAVAGDVVRRARARAAGAAERAAAAPGDAVLSGAAAAAATRATTIRARVVQDIQRAGEREAARLRRVADQAAARADWNPAVPMEDRPLLDPSPGWWHGGSLSRPVIGARIATGVGKTSTAVRELVAALAAGRIRKAILALPTHSAADEKVVDAMAVARATNAAVSVKTWYGREWQSPDDPSRTVCDEADLYAAISMAGGDASKLCAECPFAASCFALKQKAASADLWIIPTATLTSLPAAMADADLLVIDEDLVGSLLWGLSDPDPNKTADHDNPKKADRGNRPTIVSAGTLREAVGFVVDRVQRGFVDAVCTAIVAGMRQTTVRTLMDDGVDGHGCFELAGMPVTAAELREARRILFEHKAPVSADITDAPLDVLSSPAAKQNAIIFKVNRLLDALAGAMESGLDRAGRVVVRELTGPDESSYSACLVSGLKPLAAALDTMPVLRLDATLRPEIERAIFPDIEILPAVEVEQPHVRFVQVATSGALTALAKRKHRLRSLARLIEHRAARYQGQGSGDADVLVITYKAAAARLERAAAERHARPGAPALSSRIAFSNFKAHRGIDRWRGVRGLIVYGRTLPNEAAVERIAMALTGRPVEHSRYRKVVRGLETKDGRPIGVEVDEHPDPAVDTIAQWLADDELVQAIGRARGVNRGAGDPVTIELMANRVLPVVVDELVTWEAAKPSKFDLALAREGGALALSPPVLAARHPDLWSSPQVAQQDALDIESGRGEGIGTARRQGQRGGRPTRVLVRADALARAPALIEAQLGPLAALELPAIAAPRAPAAPRSVTNASAAPLQPHDRREPAAPTPSRQPPPRAPDAPGIRNDLVSAGVPPAEIAAAARAHALARGSPS